MEIKHISEEELQAHAINPEESAESIHFHIHSCGQCSGDVDNYKRIFSAVKGLPVAAFDEQAIAAFIEARSTPVTEQPPSTFPLVLGLISVTCFLVCILLISRRQLFSGIFLPELQPLFSIIIASALLILLFQLLDYMRRYQSMNKTFKNL